MRRLSQRADVDHLRTFIPSLRRLGRLYRVLASSGESVKAFCDWSHRHRTKFVPLFDFDVVCAALPSVAAQRRIEEFEATRSASLWLELGPHTLAATLLNVGYFKFSLPLGSLAELMTKRESVQKGLARSADQWMRAFKKAVDRPDPDKRLLVHARNQQSTETALIEAFVDISKNYDDVRVLEAVCSRHIPYQNLVLDKHDNKVKRSFEMTEAKLNLLRPRFQRNNRVDAINVSNVVRMFNHPVQEKSGERPMPIFITETKEVFDVFDLGRDESWYDLSPYAEQPPRFFKRLLFLQIYWYFATDCQFRMRMASREALLFAQESNKLSSQYFRTLEFIEELLDPRVRPRRSVYEIEYHLDWLVEQQRLFDNDWGRAITNSLRSGEQDRISYINLLHNNHFRASVTQSLGERIQHRQWDGLIDELRQFRPDFEFWKLVDDYAQRQIPISTDVYHEFRFSIDTNHGQSLLMERPGRALSKVTLKELKEAHEMRVLVHRRNVSNACVLCADSWLYQEGPKNGDLGVPFLAFVWAHGCDVSRLWKLSHSIVGSFFETGPNANPICLTEFREDRAVETSVSVLSAEETNLGTPSGRSAYIEVSQNQRVFYADLSPEDSLEMQVGFVFPRAELKNLSLQPIATLIAQTNIIPLSHEHCLGLLEELRKYLLDSETLAK